jgi:cytochrome P450
MDSKSLDMTTNLPSLNLFDPAYLGWDRYSYLATFREQEPGMAVDNFGLIHLLRYEDIVAAGGDHRFGGFAANADSFFGFREGPFYDYEKVVLLGMDPPDHTRVRSAIAKYFSTQAIKRLDVMIHNACKNIIRDFPTEGIVEFTSQFAFRLPVGVIMRMLKLPKEDEEYIRKWSPAIIYGGPGTEDITNEANHRLREYVETIIRKRCKQPIEDDIISNLVVARDRGELSHDELWGLLVKLINAGHETTTSSLSLGMYLLLKHPQQMQQIRENRSLIKNAVHEIFRYESAQANTGRVMRETVYLRDIRLEKGSPIGFNQASANRDPRKFSNPDSFDIKRANARQHLAFGIGIHRCLGAPLAQMEMQVAFNALFDNLQSIELAGEPQLATGRFFRGFSTFPLYVTRKQ